MIAPVPVPIVSGARYVLKTPEMRNPTVGMRSNHQRSPAGSEKPASTVASPCAVGSMPAAAASVT